MNQSAPRDGLPPFERVVERHGVAVLRLCRALVGTQEADDVWQDAFLAALRAYGGLDPSANLEAWLVRIARNKAVDHLRAAGRRPDPVEALEYDDGAHSGGRGGADEDTGVWDEVARLPEKQRKVIAYRYLGGLTYAQIADIMGGSTDSARRASADGIAKLRSTELNAGRNPK
ncbi:RNA polymerase sigma factor [Zhihengliuella salsuginis]|uniref:RNA polymerase sigma24 factor n=1 Tax=Zhihengliuella salsuginis TaxID=578222 RepID=A0ABQ3GBL3_9MICC|nr:RNA polymerase sigma factor [Zhihengliuella salsuginis]GHC99431.1 RNA polymerase sigma24 factor [Zhihengliuella salsuginis]